VQKLERAAAKGLPPPTEDDLRSIAVALWKRPQREFQYVACSYLVRQVAVAGPGFVPTLRELITTKSWWDTIDPLATWSDGTAVTPADLLLEWAARSGQLDDVTPELDALGETVNNDELDAGVAFAAASPALVQAQQVPAVDATTLTLVFAPLLVMAVAIAVLATAFIVFDGESTWLEGVTLIALYAIIATTFWWG
jgi:hypothetical protein